MHPVLNYNYDSNFIFVRLYMRNLNFFCANQTISADLCSELIVSSNHHEPTVVIYLSLYVLASNRQGYIIAGSRHKLVVIAYLSLPIFVPNCQ